MSFEIREYFLKSWIIATEQNKTIKNFFFKFYQHKSHDPVNDKLWSCLVNMYIY